MMANSLIRFVGEEELHIVSSNTITINQRQEKVCTWKSKNKYLVEKVIATSDDFNALNNLKATVTSSIFKESLLTPDDLSTKNVATSSKVSSEEYKDGEESEEDPFYTDEENDYIPSDMDYSSSDEDEDEYIESECPQKHQSKHMNNTLSIPDLGRKGKSQNSKDKPSKLKNDIQVDLNEMHNLDLSELHSFDVEVEKKKQTLADRQKNTFSTQILQDVQNSSLTPYETYNVPSPYSSPLRSPVKQTSHNQTNSCRKNLFQNDQGSIFSKDTENLGHKSSKNDSEVDDMISGKKHHKKHCCLFCDQIMSNLSRHLQRQHSDNKCVQEAMSYPIGSSERAQCFQSIRKSGDRKHNVKLETDFPITVRISSKANDTRFVTCPHCLGYYSYKNLHSHVRIYHQGGKLKSSLSGASRILSHPFVHPELCQQLKEEMLPTLQCEKTLRFCISDDVIVKFGNLLVSTYYKTSKHHFIMIMNTFRLAAKLFFEMQAIDCSLKELKVIFRPLHYKTLIKAIHKVAGLENGRYRAPTNATSSCILIGKLTKFVICEAILNEDKVLQQRAEDFAYLLKSNQNFDITKIALESCKSKQRLHNAEVLPTTEEVKMLMKALDEDLNAAHENFVHNGYSLKIWEKLNQLTLAYLMVFNRRRPGDVQRNELAQYKAISRMTQEEIKSLDHTKQNIALNIYTYAVRIKLNQTGYILVPKRIKHIMDIIISSRNDAGVDPANIYLFATPFGKRCEYFSAAQALAKFVSSKNLPSQKYTPTRLRKHLATSTQSLPKDMQELISDFMGHNIDVHKNIYQHLQKGRYVLNMGQLLTEVTGEVSEPELTTPVTDRDIYNEPSALWLKHNAPIESQPNKEKPTTPNRKTTHREQYLTTTPPMKSRTRHTGKTISRVQCPTTPSPRAESPLLIASKNVFGTRFITAKKTWRTPEKALMRKAFASFLLSKSIPGTQDIQDILENSELRNIQRSVQQIRSWIFQEIKRTSAKNNTGTLTGWRTPERIKFRQVFTTYYDGTASKTYPSELEFSNARLKYGELRNKAPRKMRSHMQHELKLIRNGKLFI